MNDQQVDDPVFKSVRPPLARPIEYLIIAVGLLLCYFLFLLYGRLGQIIDAQDNIKKTQDAGIQRTYASRAVTCDLQRALGVPESKGCDVKELIPYRNASIVPGSTTSARETRRTRELVCVALIGASRQPGSTVVVPRSLCDE